MPISYEPGQEIRLDYEGTGRSFYSKALSWREQTALSKRAAEITKIEDREKETEAALEELSKRITRTNPPIEITVDGLGDVLDFRQIWGLFAAIQYNLTADEKKSSA